MNITPGALKTVLIGVSTDITKTLREVVSEEPDMNKIEHYLIALASSTATIAMLIDGDKPVTNTPPPDQVKPKRKEPQHAFLADVESDDPENEDPDIAREREEEKNFFSR